MAAAAIACNWDMKLISGTLPLKMTCWNTEIAFLLNTSSSPSYHNPLKPPLPLALRHILCFIFRSSPMKIAETIENMLEHIYKAYTRKEKLTGVVLPDQLLMGACDMHGKRTIAMSMGYILAHDSHAWHLCMSLLGARMIICRYTQLLHGIAQDCTTQLCSSILFSFFLGPFRGPKAEIYGNYNKLMHRFWKKKKSWKITWLRLCIPAGVFFVKKYSVAAVHTRRGIFLVKNCFCSSSGLPQAHFFTKSTNKLQKLTKQQQVYPFFTHREQSWDYGSFY